MTDPASDPRRPAPWRAVHDGPAPPDQAERDRIVEDLETSLLVEAGAGSGKTTALLERMVALLASGRAEVHQIAAVTFTKKAAAELRERFQIELEEAIARVRDADGPEDLVARLDAGLREIERAFIGTIHAFCARLLRERPIEAGLDPAFSELIDVEAEEHRTRFWHAWLDRLQTSEDPDLPALAEVGIAPAELSLAFERLDAYRDVEFDADPIDPPDPAPVRAALSDLLDRLLEILPDEEPPNAWGKCQREALRTKYARESSEWTDDVAFLDEVLPRWTGHDKGWVTMNRWEDATRIRALRNEVVAFGDPHGPAQRVLDRWWAHRYPVALAFAKKAAADYAAERRRTGRLTFQDLLLSASRLLRESPSARRQLADRFRYLLVDEFQDTDPVQAEVVSLLSADDPDEADWTKAVPRPGALFVVGDPKQSIYRFRRADIAVYRQVRERFEALAEEGVGGVLELTANFRSKPGIGRFVDDEFGGRFLEEADERQAAFAPLRTQRDGPEDEGVCCYTLDVPNSRRRDLVPFADAEAIAAWIHGRIESGERTAGDFLILPYHRRFLTRYADALERRNVPVQVTGGEILIEEEIRELKLLLEALVDTADPTLTVAVLIGLFFGFSHEELMRHKEAGGSFHVLWESAQPDTEVAAAMASMRRWWKMSRDLPADVVVESILDEMGLMPYAAAGPLGAVRAGALGYVTEAIRDIGREGDTSLRAAVEALDAALSLSEAESPLEPGREDVVRVMNLHKAKGTEAPVVILADPHGWRTFDPSLRVVRGPDGTSRGWLEIQAPTRWGTKVLARPIDWAAHAAEEARFEAAERDRLLYVAATRAEDELVVARCPSTVKTSFWEPLYACLERSWPTIEMTGPPPPPRAALETTSAEIAAEIAEVEADRASRKIPSYVAEAASALAKAGEEEALRRGAGGRGREWGSAVHAALEAAVRGLEGEDLRYACRSALVAWERPLDGDGHPKEWEELVSLVESIRGSELFGRARAAGTRLAEVPFAWRREVDGEVRIVEGVVDLAFGGPDGWTLVDWKTDEVDDADVLAARRAAYERQLALYAEAWEALTGEPVVARELCFTAEAPERP